MAARIMFLDHQNREVPIGIDDARGLAVADAVRPARHVGRPSLSQLQVTGDIDQLARDRRRLPPLQHRLLLGSPRGLDGGVGPTRGLGFSDRHWLAAGSRLGRLLLLRAAGTERETCQREDGRWHGQQRERPLRYHCMVPPGMVCSESHMRIPHAALKPERQEWTRYLSTRLCKTASKPQSGCDRHG